MGEEECAKDRPHLAMIGCGLGRNQGFNDLPIMTIAYDNTWLDPKPVKWEMRRILSVSTVLGLIGVVETFAVLVLGKLWLKFDNDQIRTLIFLKLTIAGHLTLFVVRTQKAFYTRPYPAQLMLWSAIGTKAIVTLLAGFGWGLITPISWTVIGYVWAYCLAWVFVEDWAKLGVYHHLRFSSHHHLAFLRPLKHHAHAATH